MHGITLKTSTAPPKEYNSPWIISGYTKTGMIDSLTLCYNLYLALVMGFGVDAIDAYLHKFYQWSV
jgi:hypothetical protein